MIAGARPCRQQPSETVAPSVRAPHSPRTFDHLSHFGILHPGKLKVRDGHPEARDAVYAKSLVDRGLLTPCHRDGGELHGARLRVSDPPGSSSELKQVSGAFSARKRPQKTVASATPTESTKRLYYVSI
jgi:hypothetical protein